MAVRVRGETSPVSRCADTPVPHACPAPPEPTAKALVDHVLGRPLEWVDWRSLPTEARIRWGNDALSALRNPCIVSLCGQSLDLQKGKTNGELVKNIVEAGFRQSDGYRQLKDARMVVSGIELVREKLEEMLYHEQEPTQEDLYSGA